jgi:hypothetical protein
MIMVVMSCQIIELKLDACLYVFLFGDSPRNQNLELLVRIKFLNLFL